MASSVPLLQAHALLNTAASFHGPGRTWKALVCDQQQRSPSNLNVVSLTPRSRLTCDALELLDEVCRGSRVGELVLSVCKDQRKAVGGGVTSLARFTVLLCAGAAEELRAQGAEPFELALAFRLALRVTSERITTAGHDGDVALVTTVAQTPEDEARLAHSAAARAMMPLARQTIAWLVGNHEQQTPDLGAVLVHRVFGGRPGVSPMLFRGALLPVATQEERRWLVSALEQRRRRLATTNNSTLIERVLLLRNSLSPTAFDTGAPRSSPGLARPVNVAASGNALLAWHRAFNGRVTSTAHALGDLRVDLVACSGSADAALAAVCAEQFGIIVLVRQSAREMEALSRSFGAPIVSQIGPTEQGNSTQAIASLKQFDDLSDNTAACLLQLAWSQPGVTATATATDSSYQAQPVSLVLSSPIEALLAEQEHAFWSCLFSLRNLRNTNRRAVLGGGRAEQVLADHLCHHRLETGSETYLAGGVERFAQALSTLASDLEAKAQASGEDGVSGEHQPLDCLVAKTAWLRAATTLTTRLLMIQ